MFFQIMIVSKKNNFLIRWWRLIDQPTIICLLLLIAVSVMLVMTASGAVANRIGLIETHFVTRQIIFSVISVLLIIILSFLERKWVKRLAIIGFALSILSLILVKFYGYEVKGAKRWIRIAGFSYQPSEFIKPCFAVVTGWLLSLKYQDNFPAFKVCGFLYLSIAFLLATQPDFGMLILISTVFAIQLFAAGLALIWILVAFFLASLGLVVAYVFLPHVAARINNFIDPAANENYQVSKSIAAFEHGGLYGQGPGEGIIKQYIPDSHTDFIFSVAGEEFGAIICSFLLAIFFYIIIRNLIKVTKEEDKFAQLAVLGLIVQFGLQTTINIGVNLNLLPTKGMTLPFISYGGSSSLAMSLALGMLLSLTKLRSHMAKYRINYQ